MFIPLKRFPKQKKTMAYVEYSWISKRGHLWVQKKIWFSWSNRQLISEFTSVLLPAFWKVVHSFFFLIFIYLAALGLSCCIWGLFGQHSNSLVVACSLSSSTSCGILVLWPEIKPCSLRWQVRFLTTDYRGSPKGSSTVFFVCFNYFWLCWLLVALRGASSPCGEWGLLCLAVLGLPIAVTSLAAELKL